jgi:oligopeptide/dipeptide ABC transporter ATP-binding protein
VGVETAIETARASFNGANHLLEIDDLNVRFYTERGVVQAVRGISFYVDQGETIALVGESGSGKSVTAQAVLGLVDAPGRITGGEIRWKGESLSAGHGGWDKVRGKSISMVFQDPMTSLNPLMTVGRQIGETMRRHLGYSRSAARRRTLELLGLVGISAPGERVDQYPHEFSGGMRQRIMIAAALACEPELLIADEPTTALDTTIQAQILELIADIQTQMSLAVLLITHDLGVVAGLCERVAVVYAGKIVETGSVDNVFALPSHPYTTALLGSVPRLDMPRMSLKPIEGSPADMVNAPPGCPFHPRCPKVTEICITDEPPLARDLRGREVACWHADNQPA